MNDSSRHRWCTGLGLMAAVGVLALVVGPAEAQMPGRPYAGSTPSRALATTVVSPVAVTKPVAGVEGTWFFACCDDTDQWIGMIVLFRTDTALRGAFLTDGDSHGSYLEGEVQGEHVRLARRWFTGGVLHEQFLDLVHDARTAQLSGTFTEPAYEAAAHRIHIERGFTNKPRRGGPTTPFARPTNNRTDLGRISGDDARAGDPKRPCDCRLACYCSGAAPPANVREEVLRCGQSCRCAVCPPLP